MGHWLSITVLVIVCATLLAWFFSETGERMLYAYVTLITCIQIAGVIWLVVIGVHFLNKHW